MNGLYLIIFILSDKVLLVINVLIVFRLIILSFLLVSFVFVKVFFLVLIFCFILFFVGNFLIYFVFFKIGCVEMNKFVRISFFIVLVFVLGVLNIIIFFLE